MRERRAVEVAEDGADGEIAGREHHRDFVEIVSANALEVAPLTDCYAFVEGSVRTVEPALDLYLARRRRARLSLYEPLQLAMHVEVIEQKHRVLHQHPGHLPPE